MTTSEVRFREAVGSAWLPGEEWSLVDWITAHVVLPKTVSATPGPYNLEEYPFWRGVIEQAACPETEKIIILASTQVGKTTFAIALMLALSRLEPAPGMFAAPDKDASRKLRRKIYAIAEESGMIDELPPPRLRNDRWIDIGAARWHSGIAFNTQTLSGESCQRVFKTELSRWRRRKEFGDPKLIADERVKAFFRSLIVEEGTPSDENCSISASYEASDRRRLHVPCPECNHFQVLRPFPLKKGPYAGNGGIQGVKTADGKWVSPDEALENAFYRCERGCRIESGRKNAMVREGVWVPKGQHVAAGGKLSGIPERGPRVAGFWLNAMYAQTVSFGRMMATFIERRSKQATLQTWWNDWAGQKYTKRGKTPNWRSLWARLKGANAPEIVPAWAIFLTAAADPGPHYVRWSVRAWGEGGASALVAWGTTRGSPTAPRKQFTDLESEILERNWQLEAANAAGDKSLQVRLFGIDVGFGSHDVHKWVRSLPEGSRRRVRQLAGRQELPNGALWRKSVLDVSPKNGKPYPGGQERWEISKAHFTEDLQARWRQSGEEQAWLLCNAGLGTLELYLRELTNERAARKVNKAGRTVTAWEKIDNNVGNHFADVESMNLALAEMVTGGNWESLAARKRNARRKQAAKREPPAPSTQPYGRMRS